MGRSGHCRGHRWHRGVAAVSVLVLSVLAPSLAITADAQPTPPARLVAPPALRPAADGSPQVIVGTGEGARPNVDYPLPASCAPDVEGTSCLRQSAFVNATLTKDEVANEEDLAIDVVGAGAPCNDVAGPFNDCWDQRNSYLAGGFRILPAGSSASLTIQTGTDGVICYQYVNHCQFRPTYSGELPSRWIVMTGVTWQRTSVAPPAGHPYTITYGAGGETYNWFAVEDVAFRVVGTPTDPVADFSVTPVQGQPGTFDYQSTSTNPNGTGLTQTWTFPDGSTSTQPSVRKAYQQPGDKVVRLDVRTPEGFTASKEATTVVDAPTLGVEVQLAGDPASLEIDDEVAVSVKVTASDDGVGDLSELELVDGVLTTTDPDTLEITEPVGPDPGEPFDLAPGASRTFTGKVRAKAAGTADLGAQVTGSDAIGRSVSATGTHRVRIRSHALRLDLTLDRDELTLAEDASGPTPEELTLTVTGTNTSSTDLTDISLLPILASWQPGISFASIKPSTIIEALDGPGSDGLAVADLAPGESFERSFTVEVRDDGHLRLSIDATYAAGGATEVATGDVDLVSHPKYLLTFEAGADASVDDNAADPWNPPDAVAAERAFLVTGSMKNLTTDQKVIATVPAIDVDQVSSVNLGKLTEEWDNPATPFRVDLDPGSAEGLHARPVAVPVPAKYGVLTYAKLTYDPQGTARVDDEEEPRTLTAAQVLSPVEQRAISVPVVWPPPRPAPTPIEFYGLFTKAFIESTMAWWSDAATTAHHALYALGEMEFKAWAVITDPVAREQFRQQITGAWASFVNTIDLMRATIATLSEGERLRLIAEISSPILAFLKTGRAILTSEEAKAAAAAIGKAIDAAWTRITTLGGEDPRELARILGAGSATVYNEVTVGMITDAAIAKLFTRLRYGGNLAEAQRFVDEAAAAKAAGGLRVDKGLKGIPEGAILTDKVLTIGLGITKAEKEQVLAVAKRFNLKIMARSRGAEAAELLAAGKARLKPFGVDAKNVNDIDVILGFPKSMKDTVAIKKPKAWTDVVASGEYRALDAEQRAQVASRWQTRSKEWNGGGKLKETAPGEWKVAEPPPDKIGAERAKFEAAAERGSFDLQFPTDGNWEEIAVNKQALGTERADFALKRSTGADGEEVLQPLMSATRGGQPLPITGDVDLVALLNPDGTYPSPEKVIAAYLELAKPPLGMQHPATWSFNIEGKSMDLLKDHVLGGATAEPLAAFDPTGSITAVLFDPKMSLVPKDRASNPALLVKVAGGIKLPSHAYGLGAALPVFLEQQRRNQKPFYLPERWDEAQRRQVGRSAGRAQTPSTAGVLFRRTAAPAEEVDDGSLVRYASGRWVAWADLPPGRLEIAPQTCTVDAVDAGDRSAAVCTPAQVFPTTGAGGQQWFRAGDRVAVDLDGATPWITTVTAVSARSLTFATGAPASYLPGTTVHLLATSATPGEPGGQPGDGSTASGGELARTGADLGPLAMLGALLVLLGVALVVMQPTVSAPGLGRRGAGRSVATGGSTGLMRRSGDQDHIPGRPRSSRRRAGRRETPSGGSS